MPALGFTLLLLAAVSRPPPGGASGPAEKLPAEPDPDLDPDRDPDPAAHPARELRRRFEDLLARLRANRSADALPAERSPAPVVHTLTPDGRHPLGPRGSPGLLSSPPQPQFPHGAGCSGTSWGARIPLCRDPARTRDAATRPVSCRSWGVGLLRGCPWDVGVRLGPRGPCDNSGTPAPR